MVNISWADAVAFCKWLSDQDGKTYRLPTEAEWEYACRAGTTTAYFFGNDPEDLAKYAKVADATLKAKLPNWGFPTIKASESYVFTAPVGSFRPNPFGLYDMLGNVYQWCSDWYGGDYYKNSPPADPQGGAADSEGAYRGGGWGSPPELCRCANRGSVVPAGRPCDIGFRVVGEP